MPKADTVHYTPNVNLRNRILITAVLRSINACLQQCNTSLKIRTFTVYISCLCDQNEEIQYDNQYEVSF